MTPNKQTIKEFFGGEKQYCIPVYQRAYSWEEKQWKVFLEDLEQATNGENHYFFGNVLLEKLDSSERNDIIDGQQRITTIVIFARALHDVLSERKEKEKFSDDEKKTNDKILQYIKEDYLINRKKPKLQAVEYDRDYFEDVIIKNDDSKHNPQTPSQKRIKEAKKFFIKEISKKNSREILDLLKVLEEAKILSIYFNNKKDSVLMFELQNNRGKDLTNMEKLKSYLAYQIYTYTSKDESEEKLKEMTSIFEEIYRLVNDINMSEDYILNYFNMSYFKFGFGYRENNDSLNYKQILKEQDDDKKIEWIMQYVSALKTAFVDFKDYERCDNTFRGYLECLDVWEMYPFILKAYRLFRDDKEKLEQVFKALEIIAFRDKLVKTKADLASRLNEVLAGFKSVETLIEGLKAICSDEKLYWRDYAVEEAISRKIFVENKDIIPYIFMRYENFLRSKDSHEKSYVFRLKDIKEPHIEHIAPQTENKNSGYCEYDEDFREHYLHCISNLMLIAGSHNITLGNKPFEEKLKSYENSLLQHREIANFVKNVIWDKEAINERKAKLTKFVLETWNL